MTRSETIRHYYDSPRWARYAVAICAFNRAADYRSPTQAFSNRADAERWARTCAKALPRAPRGTAPSWWVLVHALDHGVVKNYTTHTALERCGFCYLAYDGGGERTKIFPIPAGFGVRGEI